MIRAKRTRRAILVAVMPMLIVACNGSDSASSTTSSSPPPTPAPTTSTVPETTTTTSTTSTTSTTTTSTSTSTTSTTLPRVFAEGIPPEDELIQIINTWGVRAHDLYLDPATADVGRICVAGSSCEALFGGDLQRLEQKGERIEGATPIVVDRIRDAAFSSDGRLVVTFWTAPTARGSIVGPGSSTRLEDWPEGAGVTFRLVRYDEDAEFPWRVSDYLLDPT